jgi:putative hydrolase of the HAD superfamily
VGKIEAVIFDLGGVILDIDSKREADRFAELGLEEYENIFTPTNMNDFFKRQEIGEVIEDNFYDGFRELTATDLSDEDIHEAWNLILTDFMPERMAFLEELAEKYPIYLFSNTNDIHTREFKKRCLDQTGRELDSYFTQAFYSQELGLRKPEPAAFQKVLELTDLAAETTVFIDDNADNIAGAASVGLQTIHLTDGKTILDLEF